MGEADASPPNPHPPPPRVGGRGQGGAHTAEAAGAVHRHPGRLAEPWRPAPARHSAAGHVQQATAMEAWVPADASPWPVFPSLYRSRWLATPAATTRWRRCMPRSRQASEEGVVWGSGAVFVWRGHAYVGWVQKECDGGSACHGAGTLAVVRGGVRSRGEDLRRPHDGGDATLPTRHGWCEMMRKCTTGGGGVSASAADGRGGG